MHDLTQSILRAIRTYVYRIGGESLPVVAVELLLIGVVVWLVMRFLRGTRGARLVKGVAVLLVTVYVVILMLPEELGWERIKLLYGGFLIFTFIAVVVAFQPEIRRALIQIGQARLFRSVTHEVGAVVDALVDSAAYLSRNKTGAIVAVERTVGLGALVETGTPVDAQLTAGLLNTIFYPGSALHDMGVVISNGRIAAASCQFPLAESEEVDSSLGSRHRAALGLSKECDAALIVVSEETGRISLACEGQLYVGLDLENLREMLNALLAPDETRRRAKETAAEKTGATE
ncbi:MAG: diadenylate cyclase CdaA [Phycisphaerae bacterium]|nr:diadenylate cyclase CdaA [Phycisphaerae bacterium]